MLAIISVAKTIVFGSHQVLKIQKIGGETDFSGYLNNVSDNLRTLAIISIELAVISVTLAVLFVHETVFVGP